MNIFHQPVMLYEILTILSPYSGGFYIDATLGGGGYAVAILEKSSPKGRLLGLDCDALSIKLARKRLKYFSDRVNLLEINFDEISEAISQIGEKQADGIIIDLGISSIQLDDKCRGFSFRFDAPLDMRMGRKSELTAGEVIANFEEEKLVYIFQELGEFFLSKYIARAIVKARTKAPIVTTGQLVKLIEQVVSKNKFHRREIHPATQIFQALRIFINEELGHLERLLIQLPSFIKPGGRLVIIAYHSLEDRRIKYILNKLASSCSCDRQFPVCFCNKKPLIKLLSPKVIRPSIYEVHMNYRARSARLRAAMCIKVAL